MTLRITNASPSAMSSSCSTPAPLRRIGRHITNSMRERERAVVTKANGSAEPSGRPSAERADERHVGAERQELAVREVHELQHAVDEREPCGAEREVRARDEPVDRRLRELCGSLEDGEDDGGRGASRRRRQGAPPAPARPASPSTVALTLRSIRGQRSRRKSGRPTRASIRNDRSSRTPSTSSRTRWIIAATMSRLSTSYWT